MKCGRVVYHNDLEESLIVNASKVIDLIYQMYLKAKISYEHDVRVEEYPFAREAIYNAIAHNCYMHRTLIQIRVMDDAITISNSCILPEGCPARENVPKNHPPAGCIYIA